MFGLDLDAERFYAEAARDDRVLRRLQSRLLGVRPVTAPTPLAALVWILLSDEYGPERARVVARAAWAAPRRPTELAQLDQRADAGRLGLEPATVEQLRMLGERGLTGAFGAELLRSMPLAAARNWLCSHAEVGRDRGPGADGGRRPPRRRPEGEPPAAGRARALLRRRAREARRRLDEFGQRWGEFASWAVFLLVEAARRDARGGRAAR